MRYILFLDVRVLFLSDEAGNAEQNDHRDKKQHKDKQDDTKGCKTTTNRHRTITKRHKMTMKRSKITTEMQNNIETAKRHKTIQTHKMMQREAKRPQRDKNNNKDAKQPQRDAKKLQILPLHFDFISSFGAPGAIT